MSKKRSNQFKEWQEAIRMRGLGMGGLKKDRQGIVILSLPSAEYLEELRRQGKDLEPATPIEIAQRIHEQDLRYWQIFTDGLPMTRAWSNYGKKHFERIRLRVERY